MAALHGHAVEDMLTLSNILFVTYAIILMNGIVFMLLVLKVILLLWST